MSSRFSSGAARGRTPITIATLIAFVLSTLAPLEPSAQMPVYKEGTKAVPEAWPGDAKARFGIQALTVGEVDSLRALLKGDGGPWLPVNVKSTADLLYYYPVQIQAVGVYPREGVVGGGKTVGVDSMAPQPARGANRWEAWVYPTGDDSTFGMQFALTVWKFRVENRDTVTKFAWVPKRPLSFAGATALDTLGLSLHSSIGSGTATAPDSICRPNEHVVEIPSHVVGKGGRGWCVPINVNGQDVGNCDFIAFDVALINQRNLSGNYYGQLTQQACSYRWTFVGYEK